MVVGTPWRITKHERRDTPRQAERNFAYPYHLRVHYVFHHRVARGYGDIEVHLDYPSMTEKDRSDLLERLRLTLVADIQADGSVDFDSASLVLEITSIENISGEG